MATIQAANLRDKLFSSLKGAGGRLSTAASQRVILRKEVVAKAKELGVPEHVLRQIAKGQGEVQVRHAAGVIGAVTGATEAGLQLKDYGHITGTSALTKVEPKTFVTQVQRAESEQAKAEAQSAEKEQVETAEDKDRAFRERLKQRRTILRNVRASTPITERLSDIRKLRKGQLVAEAREDIEAKQEVLSGAPTQPGRAAPVDRVNRAGLDPSARPDPELDSHGQPRGKTDQTKPGESTPDPDLSKGEPVDLAID